MCEGAYAMVPFPCRLIFQYHLKKVWDLTVCPALRVSTIPREIQWNLFYCVQTDTLGTAEYVLISEVHVLISRLVLYTILSSWDPRQFPG